jgi:DNA-binding MarR family transcriptional regulator
MNLEKKVFKFPIEVINIIQGLDHPGRRRILEVIINSGKGELTFEEIIKKTGYTSDTVNIHLTHMSMYGLLDRYENTDDLSKNIEVVHYQLSPLTRRFINKLMTIFDFWAQNCMMI